MKQFFTAALILCAPLQSSVAQLTLTRPAWTAPEAFSVVHSVRELRDGSVLVTDAKDQRVYVIAPGGRTRRIIGSVGAGPREYTAPTYLIPLPGDSTLLLDRDARRYLVIAPDGSPGSARSFPESMEVGAELVRAADPRGRVYFQRASMTLSPTGGPTVGILRWDLTTPARFDSVAFVRVPNPQPVKMKLSSEIKTAAPELTSLVARRVMPFTPQDDWTIAPSGRVAIVRAVPYRVDWIEVDGRTTRGPAVVYKPVAVTTADMKAREPKGPPFQLTYPATKPPFVAGLVIDESDHVWARRHGAAGATNTEWDEFGPTGNLLRTITLPSNKRIVAMTRRFVYVLRTDDDDLQWLEAYAR